MHNPRIKQDYISRYISILQEDACGFAPSERAVETQDNTDSGLEFPGWHYHLCLAGSSRVFKTHKVSLHGQDIMKVRQKAEKLINALP